MKFGTKELISVVSPNFADVEIPVKFVVLHYTACDLRQTLEIFCDRARKVCAHFVIDDNGDLYDLGEFLTGPIRLGAHAGESVFKIGDISYQTFNNFSIGIELVNLNGNVFPFAEAQYETLIELMSRLKARFSELNDPNRVVGHEQIAGHRGKADPGRKFDWPRFYRAVYGPGPAPVRESVCSPERAVLLKDLIDATPTDQRRRPEFWSRLSSDLEVQLKGRAISTPNKGSG